MRLVKANFVSRINMKSEFIRTKFPILAILTLALFQALGDAASSARAEEPATVTERGSSWTLRSETLQVKVSFAEGSLHLDSFYNREAKTEYLANGSNMALFTHVVNGATLAANDGGWKLAGADISDIKLYGITWGRRLEITLARTEPMVFSTRQVFEIYNGRAALRYGSFVKNGTDKELTISASEVLALAVPDKPHLLYYVPNMLRWASTSSGLVHGGRDAIVRYDSGDGWFIVPENNWATSLSEGQNNGTPQEKFLWLDVWNDLPGVRVATNPKAVQLTLFPHEEVEYFTVNLGVFKGDDLDGRVAVAEHLRKRFKYVNTAPTLSVNDWQWGVCQGKRTDANYRNIIIPQAAAAGFDRIDIDGEWYKEDGTESWGWTDMTSLCDLIVANGMKPGHWFPLQGKGGSCALCWYNGHGRDAADPANIDFKIKQTEDVLIGKYHSAWGQLDCGLLWRTDRETSYSHPGDSVYRKLLGMRRYVNAITHKHPDYLMQITCEIDNPATAPCAQNVGLAHLGDNAIIGSFRRTENADDVRDLFDSVGNFPIEGELSTFGGDGDTPIAWQDSPLWYYQFLLARHTSIYSWPGNWSPESVAHLRVFNDWRKNPRIQSLLGELLRPVYFGDDDLKNEGPWAWMFTDEKRTKALLFAVNHLDLSRINNFPAKLRWLDTAKDYLVEDITMQPGGKFEYAFCGEFTGAQLKSSGLPIDLADTHDRCAAYWIQERMPNRPQVLYADSAVTGYTEKADGTGLIVQLQGKPNTTAHVIVYNPGKNGVEESNVFLEATGRATFPMSK
jgi:hypothetical protein